MTTIASRPPAPPFFERGFDTSSGLGFVRERLALLGKTLVLVSFGFYLLTGKMVFDGETVMQVMIQHVQSPPTKPSLRVPVTIPPALEDLVMDCLEKDPCRRPAARMRSAPGWRMFL